MFQNRSQAKGREKSKRANDQDGGDQQNGEQRPGNGKSSKRRGSKALFREVSRNGQNRNHHEESAEQHRGRGAGVVPEGVGIDSSKCGTVIADGRSVGIEDLRKAMGAWIANAGEPEFRDYGDGRKNEDGERRD